MLRAAVYPLAAVAVLALAFLLLDRAWIMPAWRDYQSQRALLARECPWAVGALHDMNVNAGQSQPQVQLKVIQHTFQSMQKLAAGFCREARQRATQGQAPSLTFVLLSLHASGVEACQRLAGFDQLPFTHQQFAKKPALQAGNLLLAAVWNHPPISPSDLIHPRKARPDQSHHHHQQHEVQRPSTAGRALYQLGLFQAREKLFISGVQHPVMAATAQWHGSAPCGHGHRLGTTVIL